MSKESLTARYRPQSFAEVAGQDAVKRILSRAAATGRVAPAYLFSGTRGVGKTTLARIFAKALNCANGPAEEPCNQCPVCRQITRGAAVDVVEIDGASNTGVDNVRRLKEDVGYAPLECRYKIIIIDEAHMLSKAAFNALLKTLEEPPGHVTFIMATTEPEKFPQTIISRCQHFVFKRLAQADLARHLSNILEQENLQAERAAVNLIARRGAGSVRDSMSLLGQVLALGSDALSMADVREVLGLAGQEMFVSLIESIVNRDLMVLNALLTEILDQGVDLGFFLRELGACWRNLFLLRQLGDEARGIIDLPASELDIWAAVAPKFSLGHLHAAWQMTLDSQRRVLTSMEPGLALELLLVNLASLPDLMAVGSGGGVSAVPGPSAGRPAAAPGRPGQPQSAPSRPAPQSASAQPPASPVRPAQVSSGPRYGEASGAGAAPGRDMAREQSGSFSTSTPRPAGPLSWQGFVAFCSKDGRGVRFAPALDKANGHLHGQELVVASSLSYLCRRLQESLPQISELARDYFGPGVNIRIETPVEETRRTRSELKDMAVADPVIQDAQERFKARIVEVRPLANGTPKENSYE